MAPSVPNNRALLSAACVALMVLSVGPLAAGVVILRRPSLIRAQGYPSLAPTTGPYTPDELRWAESQLIQYSGAATQPATQPSTPFSRDQIEFAAEGQRKIERATKAVWERRQREALEQAEARGPVGIAMVILGVLLASAFAALSWNLRAPTRPPIDPLL